MDLFSKKSNNNEQYYELSNKISKQTDILAEQGNVFFDDEQYDKALNVWLKGLSLIPSPQNCYAESVWFQTSIGDVYFIKEDYNKAFEFFDNARTNISGDGFNNPFVMMRLGQCCFELKQMDKASEYLMRAYMLEGKDIFEYEDGKYLEFLSTKADIE